MKNVVSLACEGKEWNQGLREAKWGKKKKSQIICKNPPQTTSYLNTEHTHKAQSPLSPYQITYEELLQPFQLQWFPETRGHSAGKKKHILHIATWSTQPFSSFFFPSFCYVFYSSPRILSDQVTLTQLWHTFCSLLLPPELLGNMLIARSFLFPVQLWVADSSFKQPAPKCKPFAFKK